MGNGLVGLVGALALLAAGCAGNRYSSYDESELTDAAKAQPLAADGTFAEVGGDDEWIFDPEDPALDDTSLTVGESTAILVGGQPADRRVVEEGVPVRVTWDPQTSEILQIEVREAPAGENLPESDSTAEEPAQDGAQPEY